jgi:hypothetical protein
VFDPRGARVLTASEDNTARLWDAASGAELAVLRGHEHSVLSAVFDLSAEAGADYQTPKAGVAARLARPITQERVDWPRPPTGQLISKPFQYTREPDKPRCGIGSLCEVRVAPSGLEIWPRDLSTVRAPSAASRSCSAEMP